MAQHEEITPIRKQYLEIKKQYPHAILFFRLGDFYETFDQDAEITSRELDIVLTSRSVAKGVRVPMAGIPYHAVDNYLARLIEKGYHVAICEQVGDQPSRGLFQRQVVRVVTPGTVIEPNLLPARSNNYLASVVVEPENRRAGIAFADITTGEFQVTEFRGEEALASLQAELTRLQPAETLYAEDLNWELGFPGHRTPLPSWRFELGRCEQELLRHFGVVSLEGYGLKGYTCGIQAAGAILQYLRENQPQALALLNHLSTYSCEDFMIIDSATRRNLELTETIRNSGGRGTLLSVLDQTLTPMGARLLRQWVHQPLLDVERIRWRQRRVGIFYQDGLLRASIRNALKSMVDLERLVNRVVGGVAQPRDLAALRASLQQVEKLARILAEHSHIEVAMEHSFDPCSDVKSLLEQALVDSPPATLQNTGIFREGYSAELDEVIEKSRSARDWIANLESLERERTGIKSLKVGYNKIFGYYIEVTHANREMVPQHYIRKQTLVNAERYVTPELKEYESLVLTAEDRIREIEEKLFRELCRQIGHEKNRLLETARFLAELDVVSSLAEVAISNRYVCPEVVEEDVLEIREGRHPVVERTLSGERFVPNDTEFKNGERIQIITGPNMSGKSTYLRQVALIVLLAQIGSYVPASAAKIGIVDRIFTRIGAQDEIYAGQSTFMVEMLEAANILHHATPRSLLILDEIGRGTSTYDGVSIAWAIIEYIHNHPRLRAKTLFATHYHELVQLAEWLPGVGNRNVAVSEVDGKVVFLHKIIEGSCDRSYGIHVAQLAGLPKPVVQRANEILRQLEKSARRAVRREPASPRQLALFPEQSPLLEELKEIDPDSLTPIEALNKIYEWRSKYLKGEK
ncbi:MAG: DNA mismatch repair protein MutS [Anaerolineales bacterium]|nr:DNA mismatch repair protein MutS [Anaerolineales bacterium]MCS7248552.1 DNA mismatch repair protein MutS [Anaerolineales bacterium]MDW8162365.1 DNA mismatch repair protein MutS [Anaerolineales bacterium]MDW8447545.1 DNA mismatch repair protein MutS [Anaerolineales bacterium]